MPSSQNEEAPKGGTRRLPCLFFGAKSCGAALVFEMQLSSKHSARDVVTGPHSTFISIPSGEQGSIVGFVSNRYGHAGSEHFMQEAFDLGHVRGAHLHPFARFV